MIQLENVEKVFVNPNGERTKAVDKVTLTVENGDILGIIGYSGAGKSTLLRMINGLEKPTAGKVKVLGEELTTLSETKLRKLRQKIGMIFQHFHLLWSRTVWENVALPLEIAGKPKHEIQKTVDRLLERVGLQDKANLYPSQLSGGQKQRVGIARALATEPEILLCDEATSALDPETTDSILELLREIHQETGITIVLITHEMHVVKKICNKIAVMDQGKVVEFGDLNQVIQSPKHELTRRFLGNGTLTLKFPRETFIALTEDLAFYPELSLKILTSASAEIQVQLTGDPDQLKALHEKVVRDLHEVEVISYVA